MDRNTVAPVIHIHNGDVVAEAARRSGIPGEHLPFRESLVTGPVPAGMELETRARFLAESYGEPLLRVRNDLIEQQRALDGAAEHDEVVLWFEHDLFCLVNLLSLFDRFASHRRVSLIWHPLPLTQGDLPLLFSSRSAVTPQMLSIAGEAWRAYTSADPTLLNGIAQREWADFPFLRDGFMLHASRFPSFRNGLGVVENRILSLVAAGAADFATLFPRFDANPPRLGFGDGEVMRTLRAMASRAFPLVTLTEQEGTPPKALIALAPEAENVISGSVDYLAINDPDFWLGGVHITKENLWRWDEERREVLRSRSAGS